MPRFQVLVYPDPVEEFVNVDHKPNALARAIAYAVFYALDQVDPRSARVCPRSRARDSVPGVWCRRAGIL